MTARNHEQGEGPSAPEVHDRDTDDSLGAVPAEVEEDAVPAVTRAYLETLRKYRAVTAERDHWKEEALALRRRLGLTKPVTPDLAVRKAMHDELRRVRDRRRNRGQCDE